MKRAVVAAASALAIVFAGSAASGVSTSDQPTPKTPDAVSVVEDGVRKAPAPLSDRGESALRKAGLLRSRKGDRTRVAGPPAPTSGTATPASAEEPASTSAGETETSEPTSSSSPTSDDKQPVKAAQAAEGTTFFPGLPASEHAGYASGSVIHVDALQASANRVINADVAFSGASFSSADLTGDIKNEMARLVGPKLAAGTAFGRGSGLEAGIAIGESAPNQIVLPELVEAKAPPSTPLISKTLLDQTVDPILHAAVLKGQAKSLGGAACTTGVDLSYGLGHVVDASLLKNTPGFLVDTEIPEGATEAVSQSRSATRLVAQSGTQGPIKKLGLQSEVRQTIAPVTFLAGTDNQFTVHLLGEWVLRATADGKEGSVFYGPGTVEPQTPILQILDAGGEAMNTVTFQDFFGNEGLVVEVPSVAQIAIGEDPRAINGNVSSKPVETATAASGAVDVVRVTLLDQGDMHGVDLRIGHLEAAVAVPEGGITCGIGLTKDAIPEQVSPGQPFKWALKITNPNDCTLSKIKLVDTISVTDGVKYTVTGTNPKADSMSNTEIVWNDLGSLEKGESKELSIDVLVDKASSGGIFTDKAVATGLCGPVPLQGEGGAGAGAEGAGVSIPLEVEVSLSLPRVTAVLAAPAEVPLLPRTGKDALNLVGLAMIGVGSGVFLRAASRIRRTS